MVQILSRRALVCALGGGAMFASRGSRAATAGSAVYPIALPLYQQQFVAASQGFFKDEGLDVQLVQAGSGVKMRDIVASGQGTVGIGDVAHPLQLTNRRRPAKILSTVDTRSSSTITVSLDAHSRGLIEIGKLATWKRADGSKPIVGLSSIGGTSHIWSSFFFEQEDLLQAVTFVGVGETDTMLGALKSRQIDLLVGSRSMLAEAENRGWGRLFFDMGDREIWNRTVGGKVPVTANFALATTIEADRPRMQAFVNGLSRAARWIGKNSPETVYDAVEPYVGATSRAANLIEIAAGKAALDLVGTLDEETYRRAGRVWFREMTGIRPLPLASVYEPAFIERTVASVPG